MPSLHIYPQAELPAIYKWQAIAFMRCEWSDIFAGDNLYMSETYPPENQPVHFVFSQGKTLISYAAFMEARLNHYGNSYHVYGFGNMLTFPPFRRRGYGRQVLQAATQYMQASPVDVAALFCDPALEEFYSACGWQRTNSPTRLGQPDRYQEYDPLRMMLFVSEKGRAHQKDFETQPMYVDWPW